MGGYSRRLALRLGGVAAAGAVIPASAARSSAEHIWPESFALLRNRWRDVTVEPYRSRPERLGMTAAGYRDTMAPTRASLWPDLAFPSFDDTPERLLTMARAYAMEGTGLTGDASLAAAVATGLDHYRRRVYTAGRDPVGNWWTWQIGVPKRLLDAAVLIAPHLTERRSRALRDAVDHFVPERRLADYRRTSTGANRVDLCTVMLLRAVLRSDPGKVALAVSALSPVFSYVREGDGFYRDGSFIQHTSVPYQGGYGVVLLSGLATLFAVLRGSPWEITSKVVLDSVERSFAPFVHDGFCMDLVNGRGISRRAYGDYRRGDALGSAILLLSESAPAAERARWRGMVKGWATRSARTDGRFAALVADDTVPALPEPEGHRLLPMSARAVHRRQGWCAGLSMASHRIGHYEHGNGENERGWHTGSGMLYWWAEGHGEQYSDSFWHTVDPYRLPGTTVSMRRLPDGAGKGWGDTCPPARWVGGATDGWYATVGQHLYGLESTMEAFKSWFFLDDTIVCMGAGITSRDGVPVETIVDNRRADGGLTLDAGLAHLEGHGGYVLPTGDGLRTVREYRSGGSASRGYVTLWLDHGVDPRSAAYVYQLMPGASLSRTRARAADPLWARVLANTAGRQGIHVPSLGLTAVNFWNGGAAGGLTASDPCAVLVRERGDGTATLTVSDPRCDLSELAVTWDRPVAGVLDGHPSLAATTTGPRLTLAFERPADLDGGSATVTVRLDGAA
ncbi:polysaccharide lyase family 8 super-sandwich domain-containing protein [Nonomuraea africana]|uniref:Hyaluronate lyase n=1 Tax=Nonomuraea africana TaxID=46171 RepID=A0ABR9KQC3_9ACTN|nr:polysaccharide lyase family 8 super-sandwich domain-containing protein [Nonomuraea africana]MBE1564231.1 hyaluronate lyase [Nonomuraea africana]